MKAKRSFKSPAFGTMTAIGVVLGCMSAAYAQSDADAGQAAPGGGSFPGSFLIPGTNTSLKIGGFAKVEIIKDFGAPDASAFDTTVISAIPLEGSAAHQLGGSFGMHARQSNFNFDARTPTAYGELDTFVLVDFYGREITNPNFGGQSFQDRNNPDTARLVYAYGSLGPLLGGQTTSLWYDGDAMPESVDPSPTAGTMNILSNRQPQIRYTYAAANGISVAGTIENPEAEAYAGVATAGLPATLFANDTTSLGGVDKLPDFLVRARIDQAWGHLAITGIYRDLEITAPGVARVQRNGYGGQISGHLNTFGKDVLRGIFMIGQGLGHYQSDFIGEGGLQVSNLNNLVTPVVSIGHSGSANVSYTHWWAGNLRSTLDAGYAKLNSNTSIMSAAALNALDKEHIQAFLNLIWSPVPQVDLGVEYDWAKRTTAGNFGPVANYGYMNQLVAETVFKF